MPEQHLRNKRHSRDEGGNNPLIHKLMLLLVLSVAYRQLNDAISPSSL